MTCYVATVYVAGRCLYESGPHDSRDAAANAAFAAVPAARVCSTGYGYRGTLNVQWHDRPDPVPMPPAPVTGDDLYNCCTGGTAPDWSRYSRLILAACRPDRDDPTADRLPLVGATADAATMFTVYGELAGMTPECEAITDIEPADASRALAVAARLASVSGLAVHVSPTLAG